MGLLITSPLHTNQGQTSQMYLNIDNIIVIKSGKQSVILNRYINKDTRDTNPNNYCDCFEVLNSYNFDLTPSELSSSNIYNVIYTKVKESLIEKGLNVTDN